MNKAPLVAILLYFILFMVAVFFGLKLYHGWEGYLQEKKADVLLNEVVKEIDQNYQMLKKQQPQNKTLLSKIRQHLKDSTFSLSEIKFTPLTLKYTAWNTARYQQMVKYWDSNVLYNTSQIYDEFQVLHREHTQALSQIIKSVSFYDQSQLRYNLSALEANLSILYKINTQLQETYETFLKDHPAK